MNAPGLPPSLLERLSFLLGKLYMHSLDLEGQALAPMEMDVKQHAVLTVLADEGSMTQQELGRRLGIDRTTTVGVVDGVEAKGFVERRKSPNDRRAYLLTLTGSGKRAQQRGRRSLDAADHAALVGLTDTERERLLALLSTALQSAVLQDTQ